MSNPEEIYHSTIQNMFSNSEFQDSYLFYACLLGKCTLRFDESMRAPAGVSYSNCSYKLHINTQKFSEYSLINRLAILKHEMLHIINGHLLYRNEQMNNHKIANIAMDCSINQLIDRTHLPENCILPETLEKELQFKIKRLEPSEYYYDLLINNAEKLENSNLISPDSDGDSHECWELNDSGDTLETQKNITSEMLEDAKDLSLRCTGTFPNEYSKWLAINKNSSQYNWKKLLKGSLKYKGRTKTIFKPNRNYPDRMDLKGYKKNKIQEVLYIIDASGSVKNSEFKELNSEIISLCSELNMKVTAIQVDSEASNPETLSKNTKLIERKRNAGTFLSKGLEKAEEYKLKYSSVIVSTDGFLSSEDIQNFKEINKNIIFLICSSRSTLHIPKYKNFKTIQMQKNKN